MKKNNSSKNINLSLKHKLFLLVSFIIIFILIELIFLTLKKEEVLIEKYDSKYIEMIKDNTLLINTKGSLVGELNGLTIMTIGDYSFGKPTKITVNTYTGKGGFVNVEREVELSGPTHTKGLYILAGYVWQMIAQDIP